MGQFVLMYLALQRSYPRFLRAVLAAASVAILGLIAASPAAAAPRACPFISRNGRYALGDPVATYSDLGGNYTQEPGLAYKLTGRFPHATTYSFTAYDDYGSFPGRLRWRQPPRRPGRTPSTISRLRRSRGR
jgi:hypothetical protein